MNLQARLLLSYLLLIGVTLGVIVVFLLFVLESRPAPPLAAYRQLVGNLQVGLRGLDQDSAGHRDEQRPDTHPPDEWLQALASATGVRVLALDISRNPRVRFDSSGTLAPDSRLALRIDADVERALPRLGRAQRNVVAGNFVDPDGSTWLFTGLPTGTSGEAVQAVVLASPGTPRTLGAALTEFGSALRAPLLQAAMAGVLAALVLSLAVSRTIAGPLQQIAGAARAIARGDHERQVRVSGPPEIQDVATAFKQMSSEVQASQQAQQDFLVNVSHDLRTPLTSIQGYSQAIIDGAAPDPVAAAQVVHEEAGRLNRMVTGITDLARLQDQLHAPAFEPLDPGQIINGVLQRLSVLAVARQVTLERHCDPSPTIRGDGDRLAQMLTNLLDNAIRFTPAGGSVRLRSATSGEGVEITVADDGPGIPPEELERIFERFYQVDKVRGPRRGSGLGLAIAREIVLAHGGSIHASSEGPGAGSTFSVWLPAAG
ncbi:MAG: HAMP domain-containing sensor histidine kinase, partial [Anaerolineaceae bacterium]|nr:HAMP domain-containing sensor histidine kinase [Anaerolineaceae bacterium]